MPQLSETSLRKNTGQIRSFPRSLILSGIVILTFFAGSLFIWGALAPIEGAIVSPGIIGVASHRKQIQHLEGGIIKAIHIAEGDQVTRGQLLIELRDVNAATELNRFQGRRAAVQAIIARLDAELAGNDSVKFPSALTQPEEGHSFQSILSRQTAIFNINRNVVQGQFSVFDNKIDQTLEEISGLKGRVKYKKQEIWLLSAELKNIKTAVIKGLIPKDEELKLRQKYAFMKGELIGLQSDQRRLEQVVLETRVKKKEKQAQLLSDLSEQIRSQELDLFDLDQQIIKAQDVLARTRIVSPTDGTVVNLRFHSLGGVIEPGQPIMEIVPTDDELIVEVFLDPEDIDDVNIGMPADVRLTSVNRRQRTPIEGVVTLISADRLNNPQTGLDYYSARVAILPATTEQKQYLLLPGMGADVFIRTGARTPYDYLLSPIADSLQFSLREN